MRCGASFTPGFTAKKTIEGIILKLLKQGLIFLKKNWFGLITVIVSFAAMLFAIKNFGGLYEFGQTLMESRKLWLVLAFACIAVYWLFDAGVLHIFLKTGYKKYRFKSSFSAAMIGLLYSALTPFAIGGQPMQIYQLAKNNVKPGDAASFIAAKTLIFQVCMVTYSLVALFISAEVFDSIPYFFAYVIFGMLTNFIFLFIIIAVCLDKKITKRCSYAIILLLSKIKVVKNHRKTANSTFKQIDLFRSCVAMLMNDKLLLAKTVLMTFVQLTVFYLIPYCVFKSLLNEEQLDVKIYYLVFANALIYMITSFVPLPGGSGVAEGSYYLFFSLFFPNSLALVSAFLWRFITYYSCVFTGLCISACGLVSSNRKKAAGSAVD